MVDIYRIFHPTTEQYTLFSATHAIFFKTDHILGKYAISTSSRKSRDGG
jgi:hypothetical protein